MLIQIENMLVKYVSMSRLQELYKKSIVMKFLRKYFYSVLKYNMVENPDHKFFVQLLIICGNFVNSLCLRPGRTPYTTYLPLNLPLTKFIRKL